MQSQDITTQSEEQNTNPPQYRQYAPQQDLGRRIKQLVRQHRLDNGFHPTKSRLSHDQRKQKRKAQRIARKATRTS